MVGIGFAVVSATSPVAGVIFGGNSSNHRNKLMTRLLNKGFRIIDGPAEPQFAKAKPNRKPTKTAKTTNKSSKTRWGVQVGAYNRYAQARESAHIAMDLATKYLGAGVIQIVPLKTRRGRTLYRSRIHGLGKRTAYAACRILERKNRPCMELRIKDGVQFALANSR